MTRIILESSYSLLKSMEKILKVFWKQFLSTDTKIRPLKKAFIK